MTAKPHILIVDDDPNLRKTLADILSVKGYVSTTVDQEKEALDRAKDENPIVALIDLKLEDTSGLELMKQIKKYCPGTECIVLTAYASQASAIEAINLDAYGYVQKPYDVDQLLVTIRRAIEKREAEEARERLNRELADKNKELQQIIYVTSHDLRSPLVNIEGFSKELQRACTHICSVLAGENVPVAVKEQLAFTLEEDIPEALQYIFTGIAKMDSLLSGLLRLSRLGRAALTIEPLDMNKLLADVTGAFEFQLKEAGVTLQKNDLPSCLGDEIQVNQVFSNIVDNALKYLDPDRPGVIAISGQKEEELVVYCVEDNGVGIATEDQDKIYEIFRQLNPVTKPGEGLGLTIARKILDRHNGRIWIESKLGQGSKFFVSLPASPESPT